AALCPEVVGCLVPGHASAEPGAAEILRALGRSALLDLGMRLGEGTGALLAVPLVQAAARVLTDVATLDDILDAGEPS
ncbi:MAG: nicotinate-nucleotide--dimethylbenzimidazole phosphoribosyltransferase, partial [Nitriliruptorales bacterium]